MERCVCCLIEDEEMPFLFNTTTGHFETVCASCKEHAPPGQYTAHVSHAA